MRIYSWIKDQHWGNEHLGEKKKAIPVFLKVTAKVGNNTMTASNNLALQ